MDPSGCPSTQPAATFTAAWLVVRGGMKGVPAAGSVDDPPSGSPHADPYIKHPQCATEKSVGYLALVTCIMMHLARAAGAANRGQMGLYLPSGPSQKPPSPTRNGNCLAPSRHRGPRVELADRIWLRCTPRGHTGPPPCLGLSVPADPPFGRTPHRPCGMAPRQGRDGLPEYPITMRDFPSG
jgi:hypothetical protein